MPFHCWKKWIVFGGILVGGIGPVQAQLPRTESRLEYSRDIRPILAENCFACHGADNGARKKGLRLDLREQAIEAEAIVPGRPQESLLIKRIFAAVEDKRMPPAASHKKLTETQKETLKQWIAAGAAYQPHWSFQPVRKPALPRVENSAWVRQPLDAFILAELEQRGLRPAPEADSRTLARRLSLDLTGLPPTPADVEAFVKDSAPDAYERYVDRLLKSPHWAEHRARYWLDAARYADTQGLHFDHYRQIWPYRDWVIRAFYKNMPFDRMTIEQLAGDLLPNRTIGQQVATGFNRCNVTTNETGVIADEILTLYTRDRTETFARVWLGLTANCAVCHDHKYDPISQREFYALSAFFNNIQEPAAHDRADVPPYISVPFVWDQHEILAASELPQQIEARERAGQVLPLAVLRWSFAAVVVVLLGWMAARRISKCNAAAAALPDQQGWLTLVRWSLAATLPPSLLLAMTGYVNVALGFPAQYWLLPGAVYFLTFLTALLPWPCRLKMHMARWLPAATVGAAAAQPAKWVDPVAVVLGVHLALAVWIGLVFHHELVSCFPAVERLTRLQCFWVVGILAGTSVVLTLPLPHTLAMAYPLLLVLVCWLCPRPDDVKAGLPRPLEMPTRLGDGAMPLAVGLATWGLSALTSEMVLGTLRSPLSLWCRHSSVS